MKRIAAAITGGVLAFACAFASAQWGGRLPDPVQFGTRIEMGDIAKAREWLEGGLDPDFVGDRIGTGLMIAAWEGNLPLMALFVSHGANVNKANALGEQALMHAAWRGRLDAVEWLLEHGARIERGPRQWTALHYAAFAGHEAVARYLLVRGADIDAPSTNGSSPLMMAVYEGHEAMVRQLLALGADPRVKNDYDEGALQWAFKHKRLSIARMVGSAQEFAAAASLPKERWGASLRSLPAADAQAAQAAQATPPAWGDDLEELVKLRNILASKDMPNAVAALDKRIATLRSPRPDAKTAAPPAVLEISASRKAPGEQKMRLILDAGAHRRTRD